MRMNSRKINRIEINMNNLKMRSSRYLLILVLELCYISLRRQGRKR